MFAKTSIPIIVAVIRVRDLIKFLNLSIILWHVNRPALSCKHSNLYDFCSSVEHKIYVVLDPIPLHFMNKNCSSKYLLLCSTKERKCFETT